ncbi:hypothetical protein F5880DRAFT_1484931 [Lentinula raphanica]|nr:hypothetical protein F5880DRAFT_1484931 [Lentinula raphanica]
MKEKTRSKTALRKGIFQVCFGVDSLLPLDRLSWFCSILGEHSEGLAFVTPFKGNAPTEPSRRDKKLQTLKKRSRTKRVEEAVQRVSEHGLKPHAIELAHGAKPICLKAFDMHSLPVSATGWTANSRKKLSPGLQRVWKNLELLSSMNGFELLEWDGETPLALVDVQDRIVAALGGIPRGSVGEDWKSVADNASAAVERCYKASSFSNAQTHGRRGDFASRTVGFGYGNGRLRPQNFRLTGKANQAAMNSLLAERSLRRICIYQGSIFNAFNHKSYKECMDMKSELLQKQPQLRTQFSSSPFAALTVNLGPQSWSPPHMDADNSVFSWCADTALGSFDPDKGGQLVLWDLGLVIRFPPGSTILFPSALITHSTLPIQVHETRYAILQYSSGGLFRWRDNGFQSDKAALANASPEQLRERESNRLTRWKLSLSKFTHWADISRGDWKGVIRTQAGLDDLSDLSDIDEVERSLHLPQRKRVRKF